MLEDSTGTTSTTPPAALVKSGPGYGLWALNLLLTLGAAGGIGWLWQQQAQQTQQQQQLQEELAQARQTVTAQRDRATAVGGTVEKLASTLRQTEQQQNSVATQLQTLQQQQAQQQQRLQTLATTDRTDWLLAEAEYLLRLANQRLLMSKDVAGALGLLQAADAIVVELDDSGLYPVRAALAQEMAALRAAATLDSEGIYFKLNATAVAAQQLQLFAAPATQFTPAKVDTSGDWQQRLQSGVAAAWAKLSSYIQIRRRDTVYQPLLAPEYEAAVRQNVQLMFEQAQLATLAGKQQLYEDSLHKARRWIHDYYTLDAQATAAVLASVDELAATTVAVTVPDISASLRALQTYVAAVNAVAPQPAQEPAP